MVLVVGSGVVEVDVVGSGVGALLVVGSGVAEVVAVGSATGGSCTFIGVWGSGFRV